MRGKWVWCGGPGNLSNYLAGEVLSLLSKFMKQTNKQTKQANKQRMSKKCKCSTKNAVQKFGLLFHWQGNSKLLDGVCKSHGCPLFRGLFSYCGRNLILKLKCALSECSAACCWCSLSTRKFALQNICRTKPWCLGCVCVCGFYYKEIGNLCMCIYSSKHHLWAGS